MSRTPWDGSPCAASATAAATSAEALGRSRVDGSRTSVPCVDMSITGATNSKNCAARTRL
ncbi:hypothetical protein [Streptomyces sp. AHA2]|uniref:hypothetical protein n=1 Tax=Streptomyces sp. AHA2 TaxID=3064526 RepID=UPI002FE1EFDF